MRRSFALYAIACCAICIVRAASAQLPAGLGAASKDTLRRLVDSARAVGLPGEALIAKAAEGALKGADDARIIKAVRNLVRELADARAALPPRAAAGTLSAAASAIHAGVSAQAVRDLWTADQSLPESDLAIALVTLADLVASHVPGEMAANSLRELLRRRAPESQLAAFRLGVADDVRSGSSPESAIAVRTQAIMRALDERSGTQSLTARPRPPN